VIVVAGESLVDLLVRADGSVRAVPGGGPYNTARALARLGSTVAFVGCLSDDRFGRMLRSQLERDGVVLDLAIGTDAPTTLAVAEIEADGTAQYRFYLTGSSASGLLPSHLARLPEETTVLHIGTLGLVMEPIGSTIEQLVAGVDDGVVVFADPNYRPAAIADAQAHRDRIDRLMPRIDVLKVSVDDLRGLCPGADPLAAVRTMVAEGPPVALITDGDALVRVMTRETTVELPVPSVPVVDTVGAGDAFGAGFVAAWTDAGHGRADLGELDQVVAAARYAITVGAMTATRHGADPPTRDEVTRWAAAKNSRRDYSGGSSR
jgi:fructokinase